MRPIFLAEPIARKHHPAEPSSRDEVFYLATTDNTACSPEFSITISRLAASLTEAASLINRRYSWRGYGGAHKLSNGANATTFVARRNDQLFGTLTLCADSDHGLNVDETFPDDMAFFRHKRNSTLCELTKFAVDYERDTLKVLASLFHFIFLYGTENAVGTDLLIEINPRHVAFYEKMLGFQRVGGLKTNRAVDAPSQLMWLSVSEIPEWIESGRHKENRRSLYNYFYEPGQQAAIIRELRRRGLTANAGKVLPGAGSADYALAGLDSPPMFHEAV